MIDISEILKTQKLILESLMNDADFRDRNLKIICDTCKKYDGSDACIKFDKPAYKVRRSAVWCDHHTNLNRQTKNKITFFVIIEALYDSIKINDFYPLVETLRGNKYELKKKKPSSNSK